MQTVQNFMELHTEIEISWKPVNFMVCITAMKSQNRLTSTVELQQYTQLLFIFCLTLQCCADNNKAKTFWKIWPYLVVIF